MTRGTTICCRSFALLLALAPPKSATEPLALQPIQPVWTLALNNHITQPPAYDATRAFFAIEENRLVAYELASGKQLWLVEARPVFPLIADGQRVYVAEAEAIVALDAGDGSVAWRAPLAEPLGVGLAAGAGIVAAIAKSGIVTAYSASDGVQRWQYAAEAAPHAPPALTTDRIYASFPERIVALELGKGELVWQRRIGGLPNEILPLDDRLYVGSTDNFFYCLLTKDGRIDWRWRTGADVVARAAPDARRVYFVSFDNVVRAMDRVSGAQLWMKALPVRPTFGTRLIGPAVLVAGVSGTIKQFATKDGAPGTDIAAGDDVAAPLLLAPHPVTGRPMIVVVTRHVGRGDTVAMSVRSLDPAVLPMAPLPNPIMPAPTQAPPASPR